MYLVEKILVYDRFLKPFDKSYSKPYDDPDQRGEYGDHEDGYKDSKYPFARAPAVGVDPESVVVRREIEHLEDTAEYPDEYLRNAAPEHPQKSLDEI